MIAIRAFVAVICVALFAGSTARPDEPKKPEEKVFAFIPVVVIGKQETAARLRDTFGFTHVTPVPLFSAVFVWDTPQEVVAAMQLLRPL